VGERHDFRRIAERSSRSVAFDITDRARINGCEGLGSTDHFGLSRNARGGEPKLSVAIIVDSTPSDDCNDVVTSIESIREALENYDTDSTSEDCAFRPGVKRTAPPVR
jgi:hypothetical protein